MGLTLEYFPRQDKIKNIAPTLDLLGWTAYNDLGKSPTTTFLVVWGWSGGAFAIISFCVHVLLLAEH